MTKITGTVSAMSARARGCASAALAPGSTPPAFRRIRYSGRRHNTLERFTKGTLMRLSIRLRPPVCTFSYWFHFVGSLSPCKVWLTYLVFLLSLLLTCLVCLLSPCLLSPSLLSPCLLSPCLLSPCLTLLLSLVILPVQKLSWWLSAMTNQENR